MPLLTPVPPVSLGQLITVRSGDRDLPGTVVELMRRNDGHWEVRIEVLTSFGLGTSHHTLDGSGHEVHRARHAALVCATA